MQENCQVLEGERLPLGLLDLPEPPSRLFLTGGLPPGPRVAIVGTRQPTPRARDFAWQLAQDLSRAGVVVVSGGAEGVDTAAHEGAQAGPLKSLIVAPSSFACPYPPQNAALFKDIVDAGGGHLSAYSGSTPARPDRFFVRNGYLVALSAAVVVVQAPLRSGARNAARWARRLGRPVYVVLHPPWCRRGASCIAELGLGARPLATAKQLLRELAERRIYAVPPLMGGELEVERGAVGHAEPGAVAGGSIGSSAVTVAGGSTGSGAVTVGSIGSAAVAVRRMKSRSQGRGRGGAESAADGAVGLGSGAAESLELPWRLASHGRLSGNGSGSNSCSSSGSASRRRRRTKRAAVRKRAEMSPQSTPLQARVLHQLREQPLTLEALAQRLGEPPAAVLTQLSKLLPLGVVNLDRQHRYGLSE